MIKRLVVCLLIIVSISVLSLVSFGEDSGKLTILFTHDIHDYFYPTVTRYGDEHVEHGGAAKLMTLLRENTDGSTVYIDAGDFSMGTLLQSMFLYRAYELQILGKLGCSVTTIGNHEFDHGAGGLAMMLRSAKWSGEGLPQIVQSNLDMSGELTVEQEDFCDALEDFGVKAYTVIECNGYRIGVFGLIGPDSVQCVQANVAFTDYIVAAKKTIEDMRKEDVDLVIALSHSGTDGNGKGEDYELAKSVPGIDIIVPAHSHDTYYEPVYVNDTVIVSCGEYLRYLGKITLDMSGDKFRVSGYELIPVDSSVPEDPGMAELIESFKSEIEENYLSNYGYSFDDVICVSPADFTGLGEMYSDHDEYPLCDLIADSYKYEAEKCGFDDIDLYVVGLGTVRGSILKGEITVKDAFEICSLGSGVDGFSGHPLVTGYLTGKEIKLLAELDASLGPYESSIKMNYSGLRYTFNTKRIILDRVTDICLVRDDGTCEELEDDRLYRVCTNMYSVNMLSMVADLTGGILSITPKHADGTVCDDYYELILFDSDNRELKEWISFVDYLASFDKGSSGYPEIPSRYLEKQGRKNKVSEGGLAVIRNPGTACSVVPTVFILLLVLILIIVANIVLFSNVSKNRRKGRTKS